MGANYDFGDLLQEKQWREKNLVFVWFDVRVLKPKLNQRFISICGHVCSGYLVLHLKEPKRSLIFVLRSFADLRRRRGAHVV